MRQILFIFLVMSLCTITWADGDWTTINSPNAPSARFGQSMIALPNGEILLFGGAGFEGVVKNDLFLFQQEEWSEIQPANDPPPARRDHVAWQKEGLMYIAGGLGQNQQMFNDLWKYDPGNKQWTELDVTGGGGGGLPTSRYGHSVSVTPFDSVIISGGTDSAGNKLPDSWELNEDNEFYFLADAPSGFSHFSTQTVGNLIYAFGQANTVWVYNINAFQWTSHSVDLDLSGFTTTALGKNSEGEDVIYIFGGKDQQGNESDKVYEYNPTTNAIVQRETSMPVPVAHGAGAILPPTSRTENELRFLFFGGITNGQPTNATLGFSSEGNNPPPPTGDPEVSGQIGMLSRGRYALYSMRFEKIQPEVKVELKWEQAKAKLVMHAFKMPCGKMNHKMSDEELMQFAYRNMESFDEVVPSRSAETLLEKKFTKVKILYIMVRHRRRTAPAHNIQLLISKIEKHPKHLFYMFPVGCFGKQKKERTHFVRFPKQPARWFSRYPKGIKVIETTTNGEKYWEWKGVEQSKKSHYAFRRMAFVRFWLP